MGMFDRIMFTCPKCNHLIEEQSKAGECILHDYSQDNVPVVIAMSIEHNTVHCSNCDTSWKIQGIYKISGVPMRLVQPD